jgi:Putative prokaryotic signal transducing protein
MEVGVRLTVVPNQIEAEIVCAYLRTNGIKGADRAADVSIYGAGGFGGNREILVSRDDLEAARRLLAAKQLQGS